MRRRVRRRLLIKVDTDEATNILAGGSPSGRWITVWLSDHVLNAYYIGCEFEVGKTLLHDQPDEGRDVIIAAVSACRGKWACEKRSALL